MGKGCSEILNKPPRWLYRFRSAGTDYFEDELERCLRREIFLSPLSSQNDPFESQPAYSRSTVKAVNDYIDSVRRQLGKYTLPTGTNLLGLLGDDHQQRSLANKMLRRTPERAERFIHAAEHIYAEQTSVHGIACFVENSRSHLMWAHYTAGFRGVSIAYEWDQKPLLAGNWLNPVKIRYVKSRPQISTIDLLRMGRRGQDAFKFLQDAEHREGVIDGMYFSKSLHWEYEQEWRILGINSTGYHVVESMKPAAIILGARSTNETFEKVQKIVGSRLRVLRSRLSKTEYEVEIPTHWPLLQA